MKTLFNRFKSLSLPQKAIMLLLLLTTLPAYLNIPLLIILTIVMIIKGVFRNSGDFLRQHLIVVIYMVITILVCAYYHNNVGIVFVIAMLLVVSWSWLFHEKLEQKTFDLVITVLIGLSVLWALYGFYEEIRILLRLHYNLITLHIFARRENRINSVFLNANYYAMMIEFVIMMILYKFHQSRNQLEKRLLVAIGIINMIALYYTGCRTGIVALIGGILVFLLVSRKFKVVLPVLAAVSIVTVFFIINPSYFPRADYLWSNITDRLDIWQGAIYGIKQHWLLGQGPYTYMLTAPIYNNYPTQHAHNIYLDYMMNYGLVGVAFLGYLISLYVRDFFTHLNLNKYHLALIISVIVIVLLHGIFDVTILFVHTMIVFLFIIFSYKIKTKESTFDQTN